MDSKVGRHPDRGRSAVASARALPIALRPGMRAVLGLILEQLTYLFALDQ